MQHELWRVGVAELAKAIREKQVSSREVVQAHLARIDAVNGKLNAVTVVLQEEALRAAEEADKAIARGTTLGPLHGVPMTVKENIDLAQSPTTQGVVALKDALPPIEAPHVTQLKQAGAIPLGRTNLPDFGLRWYTDNALRGATKNPWDSSRTPGGSSGGDAVALATGMTPLGLGNDYGGSLRYPSQCCGTTALRPTLGRVAWASSLAAADYPITIQLFAVQGPMARHVQDLRLALAAMSGPDARDPWWTPAPLVGPALERPLKVAVSVDPGKMGVESNVAAGVRKAAQLLAAAGYTVEEVDPPALAQAADLWRQLIAADIRAMFLPVMQETAGAGALKFLQDFLDLVPESLLLPYVSGLAERNRLAREWTQFAQQYPLILGPISTVPPFPVGYDLAGKAAVQELLQSMRLVVSVNLLGLPSVAVPVGLAEGLPQAVQLIGPRYREDLCLDAAEAIEQQVGILTPIEPKG
ncbi:MAG: amidase [Deltaproteobacteria bacterium]|nr:amidase [Deltaproteobacteria bacterium]